MKKSIIAVAGIALILTVALAILYQNTKREWILTIAITSGTIAYHFCIRLFIGALFNAVMRNRADYSKRRYQLRRWEERLYKAIRVKQWKRKIPTYDSKLFDPSKHTWSEIAQAMCQAELVHETIIIASFVPIIASLWFGAMPVFIITSVAAAAIDLIFVIIQRYNRPRVVKMIERDKMLNR